MRATERPVPTVQASRRDCAISRFSMKLPLYHALHVANCSAGAAGAGSAGPQWRRPPSGAPCTWPQGRWRVHGAVAKGSPTSTGPAKRPVRSSSVAPGTAARMPSVHVQPSLAAAGPAA
eukprot:1957473-Pyramimonas_sp.AAC.1